jgi:hypothetical protein
VAVVHQIRLATRDDRSNEATLNRTKRRHPPWLFDCIANFDISRYARLESVTMFREIHSFPLT